MAVYRVKRPIIRKVAVVKRPANGRALMLKEDGPGVEIVAPILKAAGDWRVAYAVIAEPGAQEGGGITGDGNVAKGADGLPIIDTWDADSIREACHSFARNGAQMTAGHFTDDKAGSFVENFVAPADMMIEGHPVKAGSWVIGLDPSAETRAAIDSGELAGFSVEGDAVRELVAHADADDDLLEVLAVLAKTFDPAKHPRAPAGTSAGGKFAAGSGTTTTSKQAKFQAAAAADGKRAAFWAARVRSLSAAKGGKTKQAKAARAKLKQARMAARIKRAHEARVARHKRQHDSRVRRHDRKRAARLRAQVRAQVKGQKAQIATVKRTAAAQKRSATAAKRATKQVQVATGKSATKAKVRAAATRKLMAKGIGSSVQEPIGTGNLWNTPGLNLPPGIQHIAQRLIAKGVPKDRAIATAVAAIKQGCATGKFGNATLKPETRAQACKVAAEWEAAKAKARAS